MSGAAVTVVFGAGTAVGAAAATLLAQAGSRLVIGGDAAAGALALALRAAGHDVLSIGADPLHADQVAQLVAQAVAHYGQIDGLYYHVEPTLDGDGALADIDPARFQALMAQNLKGVFHAVKHVLPQLASHAGALVLSAAPLARPGAATAYECSVAGLVTFMKCVAYQYGPQGVRANAIVPRSPVAAGADAVDPAEAARLALFLLSDDASFITGTAMTAGGGAPSPWPA